MSDKIIVYYSRADENYMNGQLKMLDKGNTEVAAEIIRQLTGADIFRIEQARSDQNRNARPKLKSYPESLDEYQDR